MNLSEKHLEFRVQTEEPLNGGPPLELLRRDFVTPQELFFARNHGSIPQVNPAHYRLVINGLVKQPLSLSLPDIRDRFPQRTRLATLQCAGNRRDELMAVAPIPGDVPWGAEAIGNARWSGVPLAELLQAAGIGVGARHVAFLGLDEVERGGQAVGFGGSIPLEVALAPQALLADRMNGRPLTPLHGFPLRVVVPGYIGARSVKWLAQITVQPSPSNNYFQSRAYKLFPPQTQAESADWSKGLMLGELSVNSVICRPQEGQTIPAGPILMQGYALTGLARRIERVDLSLDGGESWRTAKLADEHHPGTWCFWEARLQLDPGPAQLIVRAWDSAANTQPEESRRLWNFKGYMNNAWHRVNFRLT